jgi:hypothetical protein
MPGYSGTPLAKKLGLKPDARLALLSARVSLLASLAPMPEGVSVASELGTDNYDVILLFVSSRDALVADFATAAGQLQMSGGLWVGWPKRASGVLTDLTEDVVREVGLAAGLVDNKVCAIDDTWSGLRFVFRLRDRKT